MANIMVTRRCNANCTYCFANEFVNKENCDMSLGDFRKSVDFVAKTDSHIGIIGGEPLIAEHIEDMLDYIISHPKIESCTLYTNGINLSRVETRLIHPKFSVLVNFNNDNMIGEINRNKIIESLDRLNNLYYKGDSISLGINMYCENFEYQYIIDLCKRYNKRSVRTSVCVPNSDEHRNFSSLQWFKLMKPSVFEFFTRAVAEGIVPNYDCNALPTCVLTEEELEWVNRVGELARLNGIGTNLADGCSTCSPVIDILPDLRIVRCFGMSQDLKLTIDDFSNIPDIVCYIDNRIDCFKNLVTSNPECKSCESHLTQKCTGGCLAYKSHKIKLAYESVCEVDAR